MVLALSKQLNYFFSLTDRDSQLATLQEELKQIKEMKQETTMTAVCTSSFSASTDVTVL